MLNTPKHRSKSKTSNKTLHYKTWHVQHDLTWHQTLHHQPRVAWYTYKKPEVYRITHTSVYMSRISDVRLKGKHDKYIIRPSILTKTILTQPSRTKRPIKQYARILRNFFARHALPWVQKYQTSLGNDHIFKTEPNKRSRIKIKQQI